jgi:hypothetical protein
MKITNWLVLIIISSRFLYAGEGQAADENYLLSKHKAGDLSIGMAVDDVFRAYDRDRVKLVDLNLEGGFSPALEIYIDGSQGDKPSMKAEITLKDWWVIWRISVLDKRFKTTDGIGIGSTLGDIRSLYTGLRGGTGEGSVSVYVRELEMGFGLGIDLMDLPDEWFKTSNQELIPDSIKVVRVGIHMWGY